MYSDRINSAFVMDLFIQHSYRRQTLKTTNRPDFMVLNESERKYFMSGIAAYMGALNLPNQITRDHFEKAVKALYEVIPDSISLDVEGLPTQKQKPLRQRLSESDDPIQDVSNDVRSTGILTVDQSKSGAPQFAQSRSWNS